MFGQQALASIIVRTKVSNFVIRGLVKLNGCIPRTFFLLPHFEFPLIERRLAREHLVSCVTDLCTKALIKFLSVLMLSPEWDWLG